MSASHQKILKFHYLLSFFLLYLLSCQNEKRFSIAGCLPGGIYNGESIYLVPIENVSKERVDSSVVDNGFFRFEGEAIHPEIYVIRARPLLRLNLEELLVVKEPGNLTVQLDKSSSVHGTALNDSLQIWKERKMRYDFVNAELIKRFRESKDDTEKQALKAKQDSLHVLSNQFHFNFVLRNEDNIVGQFVQKIMDGSFTDEQKQALIKK
jgi:hypothetical protein